MNNGLNLDSALSFYEAALVELEEKVKNPSPDLILQVLTARQAVQAALTDAAQPPTKTIMAVIQLDSRLKKQGKAIAQCANLLEWRTTIHPLPEDWWWFLEASEHRLDRLDWL